jgi:hypothetical protein
MNVYDTLKALDCCANLDCDNCPYLKTEDGCIRQLCKDALMVTNIIYNGTVAWYEAILNGKIDESEVEEE